MNSFSNRKSLNPILTIGLLMAIVAAAVFLVPRFQERMRPASTPMPEVDPAGLAAREGVRTFYTPDA